MNHPAKEIVSEIHWVASMGLDFIDLTLEPPEAAVWKIDSEHVSDALSETGLPVVGHTAYYLPFASPFERIRRAAVAEMIDCVRCFARFGAEWINVHPDGNAPLHSREFLLNRNIQSMQELVAAAADFGVGIMLENTPGRFNSVTQLAPLLEAVPDLGLHLDLGHCNLVEGENTAEPLLHHYAARLKHVHLHDNKGGTADLHLPLGTGTVDASRQVKLLKAARFDGTITLEVFCPDPRHLAHSRDVLRQLWDETPARKSASVAKSVH